MAPKDVVARRWLQRILRARFCSQEPLWQSFATALKGSAAIIDVPPPSGGSCSLCSCSTLYRSEIFVGEQATIIRASGGTRTLPRRHETHMSHVALQSSRRVTGFSRPENDGVVRTVGRRRGKVLPRARARIFDQRCNAECSPLHANACGALPIASPGKSRDSVNWVGAGDVPSSTA